MLCYVSLPEGIYAIHQMVGFEDLQKPTTFWMPDMSWLVLATGLFRPGTVSVWVEV